MHKNSGSVLFDYNKMDELFELRVHPPQLNSNLNYLSDRPQTLHTSSVNTTSHFEFQVDISILATVSEELTTLL